MFDPMGIQLKTCHCDGGSSFNSMKAISLFPPEPADECKNSQSC